MTALTSTGAAPTVGADEDTWGTELNVESQAQHADLVMLNTCGANRIKGRNNGTSGEVEDLTGAEVVAMLDAMAGATQSTGGTQGVVPTPAAGTQNRPLCGDGTFKLGIGRAFGTIITSTSVSGSTPTIAGSLNVASISNVTESGGSAYADLTLTNALPSAVYTVSVSRQNSFLSTSYDLKTTTTVRIQWEAANPAEISVSGFA